ncbi:ABC transporter ATP-binding protein [Chitinophaga sancti]|uniref:ABC transporter ATP-binding protein n=1 Tax=Chitinophaga sancti TaxID=1004 RepID=UPI002A74F946|nr:ABC transporter ATP-binding protein [Chitinophaga sancti]WPQ60116.1 ABC transporter ATP-binding protein [Chitinophaga sancti]
MQLEIKDLHKTYANGKQALKGISLTIGRGMFGLLGQNGAGKSTLMRTIATLQEPDKGSIMLDGIDVLRDPAAMRKVLGYLPQDFGVYQHISAIEMLDHIAEMKGILHAGDRADIVNELLLRVNLHHVRRKKLGTYSGGMKQRFGIAQALLGSPKVIIVDEPTAGLDPLERNRFYNLLSEIGENTIVILSTHIVEDVSTLCNDMAIIGDGQVLRYGKPEEIEQALSGKLWEKVVSKDTLQEYRYEGMEIISSRFHAGRLIITVLADAPPHEGFVAKTPSLEDAYFEQLKC